LSSSQTTKQEKEEGSHCKTNPVALVLGSVLIPLCKSQSTDSELSRNSEKSSEYPGFTDKIVLSGDFQDSPIHPPLGDMKILSIGI
jgi:hypothetical protein